MRITVKFTGAVAAALLAGSIVQAQDTADQRIPFDVRKTGVVNVIKDKDGNISNIRLVVTSYEITMDDASKPLESMDGYKVRMVASFSIDEAGKNWLTVKNVETLAAAQSAEAAAPAADATTPDPAAEPAKAEPEKPAEAAATPAAPEVKPPAE